MFSPKDIQQINSIGISLDTIEKQTNYFRTGFPFINLDRPARIEDGFYSLMMMKKNFSVVISIRIQQRSV